MAPYLLAAEGVGPWCARGAAGRRPRAQQLAPRPRRRLRGELLGHRLASPHCRGMSKSLSMKLCRIGSDYPAWPPGRGAIRGYCTWGCDAWPGVVGTGPPPAEGLDIFCKLPCKHSYSNDCDSRSRWRGLCTPRCKRAPLPGAPVPSQAILGNESPPKRFKIARLAFKISQIVPVHCATRQRRQHRHLRATAGPQ